MPWRWSTSWATRRAVPRAFVLLVIVFATLDHPGVEQGDQVVAAGRPDDGCGPLDADLRSGDAHAFAEGVLLGDAVCRRLELGDDTASVVGLRW